MMSSDYVTKLHPLLWLWATGPADQPHHHHHHHHATINLVYDPVHLSTPAHHTSPTSARPHTRQSHSITPD
jgi:hypothetical protein